MNTKMLFQNMTTKIIVPGELCRVEAVEYIARRYHTTPRDILECYFVQTGKLKCPGDRTTASFSLAPNEIALLDDLGAQPSVIEIK